MKNRDGAVHGIGYVIEVFTRVGLSRTGLAPTSTLADIATAGADLTRAQYNADDVRRHRPSARTMHSLGDVAEQALGRANAGHAPVRAGRVSPRARKQVRQAKFFLSDQHRPQGIAYVEMERPEKWMPDIVLAWEGEDTQGQHQCYTAGMWLHGQWASKDRPLMITAARAHWEENEFSVDILKVGEPDIASAPDADSAQKLCNTLVDRCEPIITATLVHNSLKPLCKDTAKRFGEVQISTERSAHNEARALARASGKITRIEAFDGLDPPPRSDASALDALIESARWSGRTEAHNLQRDEAGANAQAPVRDCDVAEGLLVWIAKLRMHNPEPDGECGAVQITAAVVLHALRSIEGKEPEARRTRAVLVSRKLREAIREAGHNEEARRSAQAQLRSAQWYVENEHPVGAEPRAVTLGAGQESEEGQALWALGVWTEGAHASTRSPFSLAMVALPDNRIMISGATLGETPEAFDISDDEPHNTVLSQRATALAEASEIALNAIAHHSASGGGALLRATSRRSTATHKARNTRAARGGYEPIGIFAIARAPEPQARARDAEQAHGRIAHPGERGPLSERHWVGAHPKWQAWGKQSKLRKLIEIAPYERGPTPREDQLVMTRLRSPKRRTRDA